MILRLTNFTKNHCQTRTEAPCRQQPSMACRSLQQVLRPAELCLPTNTYFRQVQCLNWKPKAKQECVQCRHGLLLCLNFRMTRTGHFSMIWQLHAPNGVSTVRTLTTMRKAMRVHWVNTRTWWENWAIWWTDTGMVPSLCSTISNFEVGSTISNFEGGLGFYAVIKFFTAGSEGMTEGFLVPSKTMSLLWKFCQLSQHYSSFCLVLPEL